MDKIKEKPSVMQLEEELKRERYKRSYRATLKSMIYTLIVVAAISVLVATFCLPVLQIYGSSMNPTLQDGEVVVSVNTDKLESGDILAFYYNNKIMVKRVIARAGDWVDFDRDGTVYVNAVPVDEPYLIEKAFGECDIKLPYQVPHGEIFVMGDHRSTSIDSRSMAIGCVKDEQIVGKVIFRIWPLKRIGTISD